jgi:hypothetical protein
MEVHGMANEDDPWICVKGEHDGNPILIRAREGLGDLISQERHRRLLRIVWCYDIDHPSGLPSPELSEEMGFFENMIVEALEADRLCVFFGVILHNGAKEWLAYTSDAQDAQDTCNRINLALQDYEPFPIEMTVDDDPNWGEYHKLLVGKQ